MPIDRTRVHRKSGWVLVAGFALATLGLVAESAQDNSPPVQPAPQNLPFTSAYGTADSGGGMVAVTGVDVTGGSILFVLDTETRRLSVYSATGGTNSTHSIRWIGARNIDLDLQVNGWNDRSEMTFRELESRFLQGEDVSDR